MIAFSAVGTNDLKRARAFYDELLGIMGAKVVFERPDGMLMSYGNARGAPMFSICEPFDGAPASVGNGAMVAFDAKDPAQAKELYDKAISLGATCEGEPGPRLDGSITCAYVRDLDGNKLNFLAQGS